MTINEYRGDKELIAEINKLSKQYLALNMINKALQQQNADLEERYQLDTARMLSLLNETKVLRKQNAALVDALEKAVNVLKSFPLMFKTELVEIIALYEKALAEKENNG